MEMNIKFNPRKLMGLAIEAMRRTVPEPRKDGEASPLVGETKGILEGLTQ